MKFTQLVKINTYYFVQHGNPLTKCIFKTISHRKVGFLVKGIIWSLFVQTGNVETYLLLKQLENDYQHDEQLTMTQSNT